jgi:hypothetical protein
MSGLLLQFSHKLIKEGKYLEMKSEGNKLMKDLTKLGNTDFLPRTAQSDTPTHSLTINSS